MHYTVGAIIQNDEGKYLIVDRKSLPFGLAGIAGHVDEGEDPETALFREVKEESGLKVVSHFLLREEELHNNICRRDMNIHYWYIYKCICKGKVKRERRTAYSIGWFSMSELQQIANNGSLEPSWEYWLEESGIIF